MKSNQIRIAVILGSISIIGIIVFQLYWVNKSFDLAERQFNQTIEIALYNVAEKMATFNGHELPNENPVRQASSNYFIVDINDVIDASILEHYLKTEFEYRNINIDYEYAIYDCENDQMVFGNYINPSDKTPKEERKFQKYDEFTYYFGIIFPTKTMYILNTMNIWMISSFVLITALIFFAYAIFIILRQKRLSEIQKDFINNMTHEFKTPISTIGISAGVLSDPEIAKDPNRLVNYAAIIAEQNKRLEYQIEKVLQLARIEKNKLKLNPEEIDLHEVIHKVASNLELNIRDLNGNLILELKAPDPNIFADRLHLSNIIYNLADNAMKYCLKKPEMVISTKTEGKFIFLSVSDNGIGIEKKYLPKIFERFFRVPSGNIYNVKGFGIGLNYVKNIVESHRWKIEVESIPGKGSTFTIKIPTEDRVK
ncbi:MAG: HAMP domain-containing histidine kinase [Bacteroidales bacterium]|nr:HAMP domain-containing histidine kinase [Bacteroidales bacterium]